MKNIRLSDYQLETLINNTDSVIEKDSVIEIYSENGCWLAFSYYTRMEIEPKTTIIVEKKPYEGYAGRFYKGVIIV